MFESAGQLAVSPPVTVARMWRHLHGKPVTPQTIKKNLKFGESSGLYVKKRALAHNNPLHI